MRKKRPFSHFLLLLLRLVLEEAVVRSTTRICVGAVCKASAASLVETLFAHHLWTLRVFTNLLDVSLIFFCVAVLLELFEELGIPVRKWLKALYSHLIPRGDAGKPGQQPEEQPEERKAAPPKKAAAAKGVAVKKRKGAPKRRRAKSLPPAKEPAEAAPRAGQPQAAPVPRGDSDQGLES
ncbi:MAG TPA: hypothetical protein VF508_06520 [Pyrinomonadaceae bacterium]|jgi:hypothetical protein